ncbi:NUDIX domain-containing protein [Chloroflexota bacterium]
MAGRQEEEAGITVAVGAVIEDDEGRILLVKHRPERGGYWQGKWICPGGRLKVGEGIEEGIRREVGEETNLDIEMVRPLVPFERIVGGAGGTGLHVIYIDYLARLSGGELRPDDDVGEAVWVAKGDIPAMWDELHEDTQRLLKLAEIVGK